MRRLRWPDRRTLLVLVATVLAAVLVGILAALVVDSFQSRDAALAARDRTASAATRRIDMLNDRIEELGDELATAAYTNGARIGELAAQIEALQHQVRQLGGEPVVATTTTTRPRNTTTTTTSSPPATSTTTTTRPCTVVVAGRCIGGRP